MILKYFEDQYIYYFWKENNIPTTFWDEKCFLDCFTEHADQTKEIFNKLNNTFGKEKEFGLLNRLDNDTWWLLYFAKNQNIFDNFKLLQQQWKLNKIYIADIEWEFPYENIDIDYPIMHHKHLLNKMVVVKSSKDLSKVRGKQHLLKTNVQKLYFDNESNTTTLQITINKWIRHQIRAHLSSIWFPIIWDKIYWKTEDILHLRSIWIKNISQ